VITLPRLLLSWGLLVLSVLACPSGRGEAAAPALHVPILVYHRFGPVVADSMTVTTPVFESQMKALLDNGHTVIPLQRWVDYRRGKAPAPPPRTVVITADDGHRTVYTEMFPLIKRLNIPVTLFVYPSAISNATYALTWAQLREMRASGLVEVHSHSYWHPNFRREKKRLGPEEYNKFVAMQLTQPRRKIEHELGGSVDMLAWPFGLYDDELIEQAKRAGYVAAFTIERRHAGASDNLMAIPRYLVTDRDRGRVFAQLLAAAAVR
jgi:peptidoglycan/xylan/chitin deacetylase (PgdA/CDA1 family)